MVKIQQSTIITKNNTTQETQREQTVDDKDLPPLSEEMLERVMFYTSVAF